TFLLPFVASRRGSRSCVSTESDSSTHTHTHTGCALYRFACNDIFDVNMCSLIFSFLVSTSFRLCEGFRTRSHPSSAFFVGLCFVSVLVSDALSCVFSCVQPWCDFHTACANGLLSQVKLH